MLFKVVKNSFTNKAYILIGQRAGDLFIKKNEFHKEKAERWASQ